MRQRNEVEDHFRSNSRFPRANEKPFNTEGITVTSIRSERKLVYEM
jgi:hypothetical protein